MVVVLGPLVPSALSLPTSQPRPSLYAGTSREVRPQEAPSSVWQVTGSALTGATLVAALSSGGRKQRHQGVQPCFAAKRSGAQATVEVEPEEKATAKEATAKRAAPKKALAKSAPTKNVPARRTTVGVVKKKRPPFDPTIQVGVTEPLGYFDPLGFAKKGDRKGFWKLREAEIKHGRVAMMASVGLIMQHYVHLTYPVYKVNIKTAPYSLGAWGYFYGPWGLWCFLGIVFVTGVLELAVWIANPKKDEPGNYGDPLGLNLYTEDMRNKELNNGRFAMFAVMGIFAAEIVTGLDAVEQLGTVLPLEAIGKLFSGNSGSEQLGPMGLGYSEPLGLRSPVEPLDAAAAADAVATAAAAAGPKA